MTMFTLLINCLVNHVLNAAFSQQLVRTSLRYFTSPVSL